jgi:hypothetical protein
MRQELPQAAVHELAVTHNELGYKTKKEHILKKWLFCKEEESRENIHRNIQRQSNR